MRFARPGWAVDEAHACATSNHERCSNSKHSRFIQAHSTPIHLDAMSEPNTAANAAKILRLLWAYAVRQTTSSLLPPLHFRAVDPSASASASACFSGEGVHEFISRAEAEALVRAAQREFAKEPTLVEIGLCAPEQPPRRVIGASQCRDISIHSL